MPDKEEIREFNRQVESYIANKVNQGRPGPGGEEPEELVSEEPQALESGQIGSEDLSSDRANFRNKFHNSRVTLQKMKMMNATKDTPDFMAPSLGIGDSKWDFRKGQDTLTVSEAYDINNIRGERQRNFDKWSNGILKMVGKTLTQTVGGVVGSVVGLGAGLVGGIGSGDWSQFYNNGFAHGLDSIDEWMDGALPNYYTEFEREEKWYKKLGHANFWSDGVGNGLSFLAGAVATELIWSAATATTGVGAVGLIANTAKILKKGKSILKGLDKAADVRRITKVMDRAQRLNRQARALRTVRQLYTGASYEAGVESRHHYKTLKDDLIAKWQRRNDREGKGPLTQDDLNEIERITRNNSNAVFGMNLALVGGSNMLMLSKLYGPGLGIQKGLVKQIQKISPTFMQPVTIGSTGASAAYKGNRFLQTLGMSQKWAERTNKLFSRTGATLGVPFYEGFVEEGGQKVASLGMYNYAMAKHYGPGQKNTGDLVEAFRKGLADTYGTDEGMTEVLTGFILGLTGIPGYGHGKGNLFAVQERLQSVSKREGIQDNIADFYNKNKDLLTAIKANGEFSTETYLLNELMDKALSDKNDSEFKNLENDQLFSYVKAKYITGQFADIKSDAEGIREMSNDDFVKFFGYDKSTFTDENAITKRKNKVADDVIRRSEKIKDAFEKIEAMRDWGQDPLASDKLGVVKDEMVHALATLDNVAEREKSLLNLLAEMTGGTVKERQRGQKEERGAARTLTYTDPETGKKTKFEPGAFTRGSMKGEYQMIKKALEEDAKASEDKKMPQKQREQLIKYAEYLKTAINKSGSEIDMTDLSAEEQEIMQAIKPEIAKWLAENPEDGLAKVKKIMEILRDLRHLRGRRQTFIDKFNKLAYSETARNQKIQQIEHWAETSRKDEALPDILGKSARKLFAKYGTKAKFKVGDKYYRFTDAGDLVEEGTDNIVDSAILDGLEDTDIITDATADAKKALAAIKEIKKDKSKELENVLGKIAKAKANLAKLVQQLANKKSIKSGDISKAVEEINSGIQSGKDVIGDLEKQKIRILEEMEFLKNFITKFYDPATNQLVPLSDIDLILKEVQKESSKALGVTQEELSDVNKLEAKVLEILDPIRQWVEDSNTSIDIVNQKLEELRSYRDVLYKTLFDKLRARKSNVLAGTNASNFESLYTEILQNLRSFVDSLDSQRNKKLPLHPQDKIHNDLLNKLPQLKEQLSMLENDDRLKTYEGYREFTREHPNAFNLLYDKGLHTLDAVEKAMQDRRFDSSEFIANAEQLAEFETLRNDLIEARKEADVDQQLQNAQDLLESTKLRTSYQQIMDKIAGVEQALEEITNEAERPAVDEDKTPTQEEPETQTPTEKLNNDEHWKIDIGEIGFMKAAGNFRIAKNILLKFSKKNKKGEVEYDEGGNLIPKKNLTAKERKEYRNAQRQLNSFHFFSQLKFKGEDLSNYSFRVVRNLEDVPEKYRKSFEDSFWTKDGFKNEGDTSDPRTQHVHLMLVKISEDGKTVVPVTHDAAGVSDIVFMSLPNSIDPAIKNLNTLKDKFTNKKKLKASQVRAILTKYDNLRASIIAGNVKSLALTGLTKGKYTKQDTANPTEGRAFLDGKEAKDVDIVVATTKTGNDAVINLADGSEMTVKAGHTYIHLGDNIAPLDPRLVTKDEVSLIIKLLQKYENNFRNLVADGVSYKVAFADANFVGMETSDRGIKDIIESIINFGTRTKGHPLGIYGVKGGYNYGLNPQTQKPFFISNDALTANDENLIRPFREWLEKNKFHHVENKSLRKKNSKFIMPVLNDKLEIVSTVEYANYEEYLLKDREDSQPPLLTKMPLISNNLLAPSFEHVYPKFSLGVGKKKSDPNIIEEESIVPEESTITEEGKQRKDKLTALKKELVNALKKGDKKLYKQLEETINKLEGRTDSLQERLNKRFKKKADEKIKKILDKKRQEDAENKENLKDDSKGDANMLLSQGDVDLWYYIESEITKEPLENEIAKAKKMLGANYFTVVDGFIRGNTSGIVGQVRGFGNTFVSNLAPGGVVYHETYHQISLYVLGNEAQQEMYNAVRSQEGKIRTYQGKVKKFTDLNDMEAEEYLAEEFRKWILSDGNYKKDIYSAKTKKGFIARAFEKLKTILRSLLGLNTRLETSEIMAPVAQLFQDIEAGRFVNARPDLTKDQDVVANMALLPDMGAQASMDLTDTLTNYFAQSLFYDSSSSINVHDVELLTTPEKKKDFNKKVNTAYDLSIKRMKEDLSLNYERIQASDLPQEQKDTLSWEIYKTIDYLEKNEESIKNVHRLWLNTIGLNFSLEYDMVAEEDAKGKYMYEMVNNNQFSAVTLAKPAIKILIGTLPNIGVVNSTTLTPAVDFRFAMNYLHKHLNGVTNQNAQIAILNQLAIKQPWIGELLNRLGDVNSNDLTWAQKKLQGMFWQQFSQSKNSFNTLLIGEDNKIYSVDANKVQVYDNIKSKWRSNLLSKLGDGLVTLEDGIFKLDTDKTLKFSQFDSPISLKQLKEKSINAITAVELFQYLGVDFSDVNAMLESKDKIDHETVPQVLQSAARQLVNVLADNNTADMFDEDNLDVQGRLSKLIQAELKFNDEATELRHLGADNKPRHGISLPTHIDQIVDKIKNNEIPAHLDPKNNPYTTNSWVIKRMLEGKSLDIKTIILEGLRTNRIGAKGQLISDLTPAGRLGIYVDSVFQGKIPLFRTSDAKQERAIDLGKSFVFTKFSDSRETLLGYVEDEINVVRERVMNKYGMDINNFKDNALELRVFKGIFDKGDDVFRANLSRVLDGTTSVEEFLVQNEETIFSLIRKHLITQTENAISLFSETKALKPVGKMFTNNLFSDTVVNKILGKKDSAYALTKLETEKLVSTFILNDFIGSIEQTKLIFGDLANYKKGDFFKRAKLVIGSGRLALDNSALNEWLNQEQNRRKDSKMADGTAKVVVLEEPISQSLYATEYIENGVPGAEKYLNMEEADGHAFASMHFYRELLMRTADWTTDQEAVYQAMFDKNGEPTGILPENIKAAFPTIKPQYFGPQLIGKGPSLPFSLKFSLSPIIPGMTNLKNKNGVKTPNDLGALMEDMQRPGHQVDMVLFPSAAKLGHKVDANNQAPPLYNEQGLMRRLPKGHYNTIYLENLKIQLDISPEYKNTVSDGTQKTTIILSDLAHSENAEINEAAIEYISLLDGLNSQTFTSLLKRLGIKKTKKGYSIPNKTEIIKVIQEEVARRKYPENIAEGINKLLSQESKNQKLDILVNKSDIERLLYSLVDSQVIRKKMLGNLRVQQSALGFNTTVRGVIQQPDGSIKLKSGRVLEGYDDLAFYSRTEDGTTSAMEVYMPYHIKELFQTNEEFYIGEDGIYVDREGQQVKIGDSNLLELIGFRIPTDGFHSIDFIKVKGFLPAEAGPVVVVPAELTVKVGMDFDIDKFTLHFPSHRVKVDGTIVKRPFIVADSSTEKGLREYYDAKFGPTLEFHKTLDRELAEAFDKDVENMTPRDLALSRGIGKLFAHVFSEHATLFDTSDYTDKEIDALIRAFDSITADNFLEKRQYAMGKFEELTERVKEIPKFEDWAKENKGKNPAELNHPGAVQNRIMELQKFLLSHPDNYNKLLTPTETDKAKMIANDIAERLGKQEDSEKEWSDIISFNNKQKAAYEMWSGIDSLGIFAVNNTHHVKSQLANLSLTQGKEVFANNKLVGTTLRVNGFQNTKTVSFAGMFDLEGGNIKDTLSQLLNAAADVSKDPFLFDLNITPATGNVAMLLIRAGVPLKWTAAFLNQPIIKRYLELKSINNNPVLEENDDRMYTDDILEQLELEFLGPKNERKVPVKNHSIYFATDQLLEMVGARPDIIRNSHTKADIPSALSNQIQILKDFIRYEALGSSLSDLTNSTSFDTKPPMNRHHAKLLIEKSENVIEKSPFDNAGGIITNTHLAGLKTIVQESINMFDDMFELGDLIEKTGVYNIINNLPLTNDQILKFLEKFENDFVISLLTQTLNLEPRISELFFGDNSLAKRIQDLKTDPKYRDNKFLKDLLPIIKIDRTGTETDNVKYYSMLKNTFEKNVSRDSFFALPQDIQNDLIDLAILQGGANFSDVALLRLLPNELYVDKAVNILSRVRDMKEGGKNKLLSNFPGMFFRNNWNDPDIVPRLSAERFLKLKKGQNKNDRFRNYRYLAVKWGDNVKLFYKISANPNKTDDYIEVTKLGNGRFLKEYIEKSLMPTGIYQYRSIIPGNNLVGDAKVEINKEGGAINRVENTAGKYDTQAEMDALEQEDKENSKDCN